MNVVIFQPEGAPMAIMCCAPGVDITAEAVRVVPKGLPFWIVPKSDVDELYNDQGHLREAWELSEDAIGRSPDGIGGAN